MSSGLIKMKEELHHKILILRSIETAINHPRFDSLWDDSSDSERKQFLEYLDVPNKIKIFDWIRNHPSLELEDKSLAELKEIAYKLNVINYSRLLKPDLIRSIRQYGSQ